MSDRANLESESDQPPAKKAKSHYDTLSSHQVNNNKKERQKRYREQNRDKLKQREVKRRERIQYSQSIAKPSTSSNTNKIELNNEEIITAQSSSGSEKIQPSSSQRNDQGNKLNALQKKRVRQQRYREQNRDKLKQREAERRRRQQRYREQNRDKLKQREAERRRRQQNADVITESSTSPNIEFTETINDPIIDEISTNSRNVAGLEEMQHVVVKVSQQIGRNQSSANTTEIPNNYSQFRYHKSAHEYFNDNFKNNEFGHACSICDRLWFEKDLKKPPASGNIMNTITNGQNVDALKICSTCKSAVIVKVENPDIFESHINIKSEADTDQTEITENIEDSIHNPAYQDSKQYRQDERTAYNHTMADQPDDPMDLTDLPLASRSNILTEAQDAAASTSATPFAAPKSKAHKQRVYRQRIAASRTPAQAIAARKSDAERQRNCRLRKTVNSALVSGSLESTASSFRSGARSNNVLTGTQRQLRHHLLQPSAAEPEQSIVQSDTFTWKTKWAISILRFKSTFLDNDFGYACSVCDRLWFKNDLKPITADQLGVISEWYIKENRRLCREEYKMICKTCKRSLNKKTMPPLAKVNGFSYPDLPPGLPPLDPISERLISPRLPFMQVRRLRHDFSYGIIGQVINVPVDVQEMVKCLPRQLNEDDVINVNIKRNLAHKSVFISGYMSKSTISKWLTVLKKSPLYRLYEINVDLSRLQSTVPFLEDKQDETSDRIENISAENTPESEILASRQHTMMWNEEDFLNSAPGHLATPVNDIYDRHAEELSFPWIYFGEPRRFNTRIPVTPYMIANSEIRRRDRRGATPQKILYVAMQILQLRIVNGVFNTFRNVSVTKNITRSMLEDTEFLKEYVKQNLAFMKTVPNSVQYWASRKRDLFAIIRQLGKPTVFLTISANEIRWMKLLTILLKLSKKYPGKTAKDLNTSERCTLVNDDPVTCCIYFYKLVTSSMKMLKSKHTYNPFGKYFVKDYFLCIEFNHRGSPHAHILLWLNDDPRETVSENMPRTIDLVEKLSSVAREDVPNNSVYANQIHEHTFTCTKRGETTCRFGIPYWPMPTTRVLIPMPQSDGRRQTLQQKAKELRTSLSERRYACMDEFLKANGLIYVSYLDIVRSTLRRPTLVFRRNFDELMTITFNPYLAGELNSNIDIQFILDEYSCADYIVEYVNKSARGMGNLSRELTTMMQKHPERDYTGQLKALSIKLVNAVEMSAQEAAWYLLRQPMSETSRQVMYIPTVWPTERQCCRKRRQQTDREGIDGDSTDVWTKNIIQRYEERPASLEQVYLAEFAAWYANANDFVDEEDDEHVDDDEDSEAVPKARSSRAPKEYRRRLLGRVIRYRRYHIDETVNYKREMVLLYVQFRNEMSEIVDQNKFLQLFDDNKDTIMERHSLFETNLNIENVMKELEAMMILKNDDKSNLQEEESRELFVQRLGKDCVEKVDDVNQMAPRPGFSVVKKRSNVMTKQQYCDLVRTTNPEQKKNILEIIHRLHGCGDDVSEALHIFFPGPAGCGKIYTLKCLMERYNRYKREHNSMNNAYITCASKGTEPLHDTTLHSAFRLTSSCVTKLLSTENLQAYRNMFVGVKTVYVDEISMLSSAIVQKINYRLQQITGIYDKPFGGIHVILCGDVRQLPPVRASPCYSLSNNQLGAPILRHDIDYSPLVRVERQTDERFSTILNKIRDGLKLSIDEITLIQSRHKSVSWCKENVPNAVRLYYSNTEVDSYNQSAIINAYNCLAHDIMIGYASEQEKAQCSDKLHKMTIAETDGLPYLLPLAEGYPYMITSNIDVADGLVNGAIGVLRHIERQQSNVDDHSAEAGPSTSTTLPASQEEIITLWFEFPEESTGASAKIKYRNHVQSKPNTLSPDWVPVYKKLVVITLSETVKCKRKQFPCAPACAITIDKSQGWAFDAIVYKYSPIHPQQIVYVAMNRVRNIEDLHIITDDDAAFIFKHGRDGNDLQTTRDIPNEYVKLRGCALPTIRKKAVKICDDANNDGGTVGTNLDAQSLFAHSADIEMDTVIPRTPSIEAPTAIVKTEPLDELLEATSEHDSQTFENFAENEGVIVKVENQDLFESHINIKSEADAHKTEITENIADSIHDPAYQDSQQYRQDDRTPSSEAPTAIVKAEPLDELLEGTSEQNSQTFENLAENEGVIIKVENQDVFESHINIKSEVDADQTEITENIADSIHNPAYQDSQQYRQDDRTPSSEAPTAIVKAEPLDELLEGSLQGIGDIVTEHDNNQMEVDDETTKDRVQNPRQMIGDRLNQAPKTSTERSREYRARKALLKQQIKRQLELEAIKSASEDNEDPGPSEIMTLEKKRAKSAEATRRWREKKRAANKTPKNPAKSAAQLMREYRARKKMAASQSKEKPAVMVDSESLLATLRLMAENDPLKMETDNFECSENSDDDSDIVKEELDISDEGYG